MKDPDITIKLRELVSSHLGSLDCLSITEDLAFKIGVILKANPDCYACSIQYPHSEYDPELNHPVLWQYQRWIESTEKWERAKRWSEEQRKLRFIFEANCNLVSKAITRYLGLERDRANALSYSLVKNNRVVILKEIGVDKLITTIEEIP
jgi:hypothetical protein